MTDNSHGDKPKEVTIHIDNKEYKSPDPTTGEALYVLGNINPAEFNLWEEVKGHGNGDDILIPNDGTRIDLEKRNHFYSIKKSITPGSLQE